MTKFFSAPKGAKKQERIPYPEKPLTQDELISDDALRCWLYVAHITKRPLHELISETLLDSYDTLGEVLIMEHEEMHEWMEQHPGKTAADYRKYRTKKWNADYKNIKSISTAKVAKAS